MQHPFAMCYYYHQALTMPFELGMWISVCGLRDPLIGHPLGRMSISINAEYDQSHPNV
jgi:hypothetical protein